MSTFQDFAGTAYERLSRTIDWGERLLKESELVTTSAAPSDLVNEVHDWTESTAFFVNFITDGDAGSKLLTLGFDARLQEPVKDVPTDQAKLRELISMRVQMLRKWFDELLMHTAEADARRWGILNVLDHGDGVPMSTVWLQERVELETPTLEKDLGYLRREGFIQWNTKMNVAQITESGRASLRRPHRPNLTTTPNPGARDLVFFNYAREDRDEVSKIHAFVSSYGFNTWWDEANLAAGQNWKYEIDDAIESAAVCLVFISKNSVDKTGYVNKEIKKILNRMDEMPDKKVFLIPFRLDDCAIPRRLRDWHALSQADKEWHKKLIAAIRGAL